MFCGAAGEFKCVNWPQLAMDIHSVATFGYNSKMMKGFFPLYMIQVINFFLFCIMVIYIIFIECKIPQHH